MLVVGADVAPAQINARIRASNIPAFASAEDTVQTVGAALSLEDRARNASDRILNSADRKNSDIASAHDDHGDRRQYGSSDTCHRHRVFV